MIMNLPLERWRGSALWSKEAASTDDAASLTVVDGDVPGEPPTGETGDPRDASRHDLCRQTRIILDSIADGVFTVDAKWRVTSFNRAAEAITGIPASEAMGKLCCEVFRANVCETSCVLHHTMETGEPVIDRPIVILRADGKELPISVSTALLKDEKGNVIGGAETFRDLSLVEELRREIQRRYCFGDIISKSPLMRKLFSILPEVAQSESTVLIQGESGTGKELLARAIHNLSPRDRGPFVAVNCGTLPDTLLETELFGHVAGAFTDARRSRPGRFAMAEGGTLFLDEIGDISPAFQTRLLRVLEEHCYEPLGSSKSVPSDVRIVAASNKDLAQLVETGHFRKDLFYRVNVVKLVLPSLAQRKEDIPLLVDHFVERFNKLRGKSIAGPSQETIEIFMNHDWPGNIRELENAIEHAFILCRGRLVEPEHLPEHLRELAPAGGPPVHEGMTLKEIEKRAIWEALERNEWRRMATARELDIDKNTLRRKIQRLGIEAKPSIQGENRQ